MKKAVLREYLKNRENKVTEEKPKKKRIFKKGDK
jgi:hypothetical protein